MRGLAAAAIALIILIAGIGIHDWHDRDVAGVQAADGLHASWLRSEISRLEHRKPIVVTQTKTVVVPELMAAAPLPPEVKVVHDKARCPAPRPVNLDAVRRIGGHR